MLRSIAQQTTPELGGEGSVLARQRSDHIRLHELIAEHDSAPVERRKDVLHELHRLVFPHAFAEETVLFPAIRRLVPDGDELTARVEAEHQEVNEVMAGLLSLDPADPAYEARVQHAFDVLRRDARDEEELLLPRLQDAVDVEELVSIGTAWETARRTAPTRPHPVVSRRPPGNVLAGVPLSVYDRVRDLGRGRAVVVAGAATAAVLLVRRRKA
jgi:hemerythrin superfamily protein